MGEKKRKGKEKKKILNLLEIKFAPLQRAQKESLKLWMMLLSVHFSSTILPPVSLGFSPQRAWHLAQGRKALMLCYTGYFTSRPP